MYIQDGFFPLFVASEEGHDRVVEKLLQAGATVDLQNKVVICSSVTCDVPCTVFIVHQVPWHRAKQTCLEVMTKDWWQVALYQVKTIANCMQNSYLSPMVELIWVMPVSMSTTTMLLALKMFSPYNCSKWHMGNYCLVTSTKTLT